MYILITGCTINGTSTEEYFNPLSINTKLYKNMIYNNMIFISHKLYICK